MASTDEVENRLMAFQGRIPQMFNWSYIRHDLDTLLKRIAAHEAQAAGQVT